MKKLSEEQIDELRQSCVKTAEIGALWWAMGFPEVALAIMKVNLDQTRTVTGMIGQEPSGNWREGMANIMDEIMADIEERKKKIQ